MDQRDPTVGPGGKFERRPFGGVVEVGGGPRGQREATRQRDRDRDQQDDADDRGDCSLAHATGWAPLRR